MLYVWGYGTINQHEPTIMGIFMGIWYNNYNIMSYHQYYIYICVCMSNSGGLTNQFISIWLVKMMRKPILRQTHWGSIYYTSSTAQGGGGSFKNRKPIGEVGCCESGMAERSHWWIERWLRSPLFLSLSLSFSLFLSLSLTIYLPTYLSIYLSIYPSIYPSIYLCIYWSISLSLSI